MLSRFPDRLVVRERFIIGEPIIDGPIDVGLFDTYGRVGVAERALQTLTEEPEIRHLALFSHDFPSVLVEAARGFGVRSFISKALPADDIAAAIVRVASGREVIAFGGPGTRSHRERVWPGKHEGLTERESQVLVLCAEGLSNREIGEALYIGSETVKTHLRKIFRRLELRNRAEATAFVHRSGAFARFQPTATALDDGGAIDEAPVSGAAALETTT